MAYLNIEGVTKQFGALAAVDHVDLKLPAGRFISFLGPSGCGKTTLLRLIAGLETPDHGRIVLGDRDITQMPTHQRDIGMVFQSLALFPHMTVGENIAYALRLRRISQAQQAKQVDELLEMVCLPGIKQRKALQLSGGQQQRVAIARALAHYPKLLLLDEPLSALDAKLREAMQLELRLLQQRLGITTILVTHDQREAMTMSDIVVVMNEGRIHQHGKPLEIYRHPTDAFVADFIGTNNLLQGVVHSETEIEVEGILLTGWQLGDRFSRRQLINIGVRPEDVAVVPSQVASNNQIPGVVSFIRDVGSSIEIHVDCKSRRVISTVLPKARPDLVPGDPVAVSFVTSSCMVLQ
jgi:putative spermidine/putrescine transport system ATP-binding protein